MSYKEGRVEKNLKNDVNLEWLCCNDFIAMLSASPFTYACKQSYHLSLQQAIAKNIGLPSKSSKPMKMNH